MTPEQHKLIDKTLSVLAYLSLLGAAGVVVYCVIWTLMNNRDFGSLFEWLFDIDDAGIVFYPLIGAGVAILWIRAFVRAGQKET